MSGDDGDARPKSESSDILAFATFISETNREVNVYWLDYNGDRVRYTTLCPRSIYHIDTFTTHPWIFRDAHTDDILLANNRAVYYPQAWDAEMDRREDIRIRIPVYDLVRRCMRVLQEKHPTDRLVSLALPCNLHSDFLHRTTTPSRDYDD